MPRLFIALEPDEATRALALEAQGVLRVAFGARERLRFTAAPRLHVTLAFLGEVEGSRIDRVLAVLEEVARGRAPFPVVAGGVGAFPGPDRARVLWLGFGSTSDRLSALVCDLEARLRGEGLVLEARAWTGHLTLARHPAPRGVDARAALARCPARRVESPVSELVLMESRRDPEGARHVALGRARLAATLAGPDPEAGSTLRRA
jgi:2'-5' RNA ligase